MTFRAARVLLTGGHGFVGSVVTRLLTEEGADVVCPFRPDIKPLPDAPGRALPVDLVSGDGLEAAMDGVAYVVHLAARSGGIQFQSGQHDDVFADNVAMTQSVLKAARRAGVRRVFLASSAVVYRSTSAPLISESDPLVSPGHGEVTAYAWSKVTDEVAGRWLNDSSDVQVVAGRFANVYGPGGNFGPHGSTVVHALVARCAQAKPGATVEVWGTGAAQRSFIHVEDCARAVLTLLEHGTGGEAYNVDTSEAVTIRELAEAIGRAVGGELRFVFDHTKPEGPRRRVLDTSKLRALGFVPTVALPDGIESAVVAYRSTGQLAQK